HRRRPGPARPSPDGSASDGRRSGTRRRRWGRAGRWRGGYIRRRRLQRRSGLAFTLALADLFQGLALFGAQAREAFPGGLVQEFVEEGGLAGLGLGQALGPGFGAASGPARQPGGLAVGIGLVGAEDLVVAVLEGEVPLGGGHGESDREE